MNRAIVFLAATAAAALAVTSACLANTKPAHDFRPDNIHFTLTPAARGDDVNLSLRLGRNHNMTSHFAPSELAGLDPASLRSAGATVSFALVRQAGRVDCTGTSAKSRADGDCRFSADTAFADLLASRGVGSAPAECQVPLFGS